MTTITREELETKREEVDKLWQAANAAKIKAAREEEEYKDMRYEYFLKTTLSVTSVDMMSMSIMEKNRC